MFNKKVKLQNGKYAKHGDVLFFIDSDSKFRVGLVEKREYNHTDKHGNIIYRKGSLYFRNANFSIEVYNLDFVKDRHVGKSKDVKNYE